MNTAEFVRQLRAIAEELKPLTRTMSAGAATWDGTAYVKGQAISPDSSALVWWSMLGTIADMIEAQESPPTPRQMAYLNRRLFGGMGSLNDLFFKTTGNINARLDKKRRELFATFQK